MSPKHRYDLSSMDGMVSFINSVVCYHCYHHLCSWVSDRGRVAEIIVIISMISEQITTSHNTQYDTKHSNSNNIMCGNSHIISTETHFALIFANIISYLHVHVQENIVWSLQCQFNLTQMIFCLTIIFQPFLYHYCHYYLDIYHNTAFQNNLTKYQNDYKKMSQALQNLLSTWIANCVAMWN